MVKKPFALLTLPKGDQSARAKELVRPGWSQKFPEKGVATSTKKPLGG
jgi:hypothetical protein